MHEDKTSHIHGTGNRFIPALAPGTVEPGLYTHGSGGLHQAKTLLTSRSDFWISRNGKVWIDLPASSDTSNLIEMLLVTRNNIEFNIVNKPESKSQVQAQSQIEKVKRNLDSGLSLKSYIQGVSKKTPDPV